MHGEAPDPIVPRESRKRLRSSGRKPSKRDTKELQVDTTLEGNVTGSSAKGKDEQGHETVSTPSPGYIIRTQHVRPDENIFLQPSGMALASVTITMKQIGQNSDQKRVEAPSKQPFPANENIPRVQGLWLLLRFASEPNHILDLLEQESKLEVLPATPSHHHPHTWIDFHHGQIICKWLGLEQI